MIYLFCLVIIPVGNLLGSRDKARAVHFTFGFPAVKSPIIFIIVGNALADVGIDVSTGFLLSLGLEEGEKHCIDAQIELQREGMCVFVICLAVLINGNKFIVRDVWKDPKIEAWGINKWLDTLEVWSRNLKIKKI